jgi:tetratricopeptide (TPR) repeat protein
MQVFRERFILTILASIFVLLAVTNPLKLGVTARIIYILLVVVLAGIDASPSTTIIWILEYAKDILRIKLSPDRFTILIARLDGDDLQGTHTRAVARAFLGERGVQWTQTRRVLRLSASSDAESQAVRIGRRWLVRRKADLLIWGEVLQKEKFLNLWFISKDATSDFQQSRYTLEANLLDQSFSEVTRTQLVAIALSSVKPATEVAATSLRDILKPVADRLRNLIKDASEFTSRQRAELAFALGVALCAISYEEGGCEDLREAVAVLASSVESINRADEPLAWANAQHYRGVALAGLGREAANAENIEDAVAAYRAALDERTRELVPFEWAKTQNALGNALTALAVRKPEITFFDEAIIAFDASLSVRTIERSPIEWASTMNNRSVTVLIRALRGTETTQIREGIANLEDARRVTSLKEAPLVRNMITLNLGFAFFQLDERRAEEGLLDKALSASREVLRDCPREQVPQLWVKAQINVGRTLIRVGEREIGTDSLREAEDTLKAALEVCTPEFSVLSRAIIHTHLGLR